jgi:NADH dehydrogenase FAD-containing subunit
MTAVNRSATPAVACAVAADRPIWTGVAATSLPRVVIVGAGFAGLSAAKALRRAPVEVTVIDKRNYHLFQPLLYQVATAALSPADIASPIRGILRGQRNASVVLGKITGIDKVDRSVLVGDRRISYDYLVVATGARHAYFGHDEWEPFAPGLKKIDDATDIRRKVLVAFEHAENAEDESERRRLMTFVVIGAGPTGVEMAGAIAELAKMALAKQFRRIDPTMSRIILVEAGSRVLSTFPESLSGVAKRSLEELGVELRLSSRVTQCDPDGAVIAGERVASRTIIWAAGVAASPAAKWLGADKDPAGRVIVGADLTLPEYPEIFIIGDTALAKNAAGRPLPGIAPVAKQQGTYVGRVIRERVAGREALIPFRYRHFGNMATIGRRSAVADFGSVQLSGRVAWFVWGLAHIYFLIGFRNRLAVALDWFWAYLTFQRGARLITGDEP